MRNYSYVYGGASLATAVPSAVPSIKRTNSSLAGQPAPTDLSAQAKAEFKIGLFNRILRIMNKIEIIVDVYDISNRTIELKIEEFSLTKIVGVINNIFGNIAIKNHSDGNVKEENMFLADLKNIYEEISSLWEYILTFVSLNKMQLGTEQVKSILSDIKSLGENISQEQKSKKFFMEMTKREAYILLHSNMERLNKILNFINKFNKEIDMDQALFNFKS